MDPDVTGRADGGAAEHMFRADAMGELTSEGSSAPPINTPPCIDPDEIISLLINVMRGSLDGQKTTTSERIRAGTLLMKYIIEGEADTRREEEDEISKAIEDYYREEE